MSDFVFCRNIVALIVSLHGHPNWPQRLCISSGGNSKRVTVPRNQTYFEKLNYEFTLNPAIGYASCWALVIQSTVINLVSQVGLLQNLCVRLSQRQTYFKTLYLMCVTTLVPPSSTGSSLRFGTPSKSRAPAPIITGTTCSHNSSMRPATKY